MDDVETIRIELMHVTEQDLVSLAAWVPPGTAEMVRVLGTRLTVRLINRWPGVVMQVPVIESRHAAGIERRADLVRALGEADANALCAAWGGETLVLPVMRSLLREKRQRWLRQAFDDMTAGGAAMSKGRAVTVLGLRLGAAGLPMTSRQISAALDRPDVVTTPQMPLFGAADQPAT